jgi:hypothetical protein
MSIVKITCKDKEVVLSDPEHINCLFNTREVAIDGEVYDDIIQVTFDET